MPYESCPPVGPPTLCIPPRLVHRKARIPPVVYPHPATDEPSLLIPLPVVNDHPGVVPRSTNTGWAIADTARSMAQPAALRHAERPARPRRASKTTRDDTNARGHRMAAVLDMYAYSPRDLRASRIRISTSSSFSSGVQAQNTRPTVLVKGKVGRAAPRTDRACPNPDASPEPIGTPSPGGIESNVATGPRASLKGRGRFC